MGRRIEYIKQIARKKGKWHVVLLLTVGWFIYAWALIGKALYLAGDWMLYVVGAHIDDV